MTADDARRWDDDPPMNRCIACTGTTAHEPGCIYAEAVPNA